MTTVLLSPSETALTKLFRDNAIVSSLPEQYGADILIYSPQGLAGIQRKEVPHDFVSSFTDGRMTRETSLLAEKCKFRILVCEGRFRYYQDTRLAVDRKEPSRFTRKQIHGMLNDVRFVRGINIVYTEDITETVEYVKSLAAFLSKTKHLGLYTRPSAQGTWYVPSAKDIDLWVLQSFPGIGPTLADRIISHFGNRIPMKWTCSIEELSQVSGLGTKRAKILWESLPYAEHEPEDKFARMKAKLARAHE